MLDLLMDWFLYGVFIVIIGLMIFILGFLLWNANTQVEEERVQKKQLKGDRAERRRSEKKKKRR